MVVVLSTLARVRFAIPACGTPSRRSAASCCWRWSGCSASPA